MTPLTADAIARRLTTVRYGRSLDVRAETGSTNDDAREAAGAGAADGHVVVADRQSRGRGARGRVWASPGGTDLYFSIVARLPLTPAQLPPLTLAVGLGVARAAEATLPDRSVTVKWPNDVLIEGKKHAGILVESVSLGSRIDSAIIGVGVDVNRADFGELGPIATSWRAETGQTFDRAQALATLLSSIEAEVDRFVRLGPRPVASAVEDRLAFRGRRVRCDALEGELTPPSPPPIAALVTSAEARRPDLSALARADEAARRARAAADFSWVPRLSVEGGYNRQDGPLVGHGYAVGLSAEIPLFDHGQGERRAAEASAAVGDLRARYEAVVETRIRVSHARLTRLLEERARFESESAEPVELLVRAATSGYQGGERSVVELLDARRAATEVAERRVALSLAARLAQIALAREAGGLR